MTMEQAGYLATVLIGVSLGMVGSGGSILTVPVLVYLFAVDAVQATAYSLFIVGFTSAVGSVGYFVKGLVNLRTAMVFGIPSVVAVYVTRAWLVPLLPDPVFTAAGRAVSLQTFLLTLFAVLMLGAAWGMIRRKRTMAAGPANRKLPLVVTEGAVVGLFTGLVGAGGGFLIIPALVMLGKTPMKEAVGTSLVIIAAKSLIGFLGERGLPSFDWPFLLAVTALATAGIFAGAALARRIDGDKLKPAFGVFILVMGIYIILRETIGG
jgi:uncharacterized membrane protein YfcA